MSLFGSAGPGFGSAGPGFGSAGHAFGFGPTHPASACDASVKEPCISDDANIIGRVFTSFSEKMGTEMVDIYVGKERRLFRVHQDRLRNKVPYFNAMFSANWKESVEKKVNLPDDNPDSFDLLLLWVYYGSMPNFEWVDIGKESRAANWNAFDLYILADKMSMPTLMDEVATQYIDASVADAKNLFPGPAHLARFHKRLSDHMAFRKYAAYCLHFILHGLERNKQYLELWPATELSAIMLENPSLTLEYLELVQKHPHLKPAPDPRDLSQCTFHQHGANEPCSIIDQDA